MLKRRKKNDKIYAFLEVLQNGEYLDEYRSRLRNGRKIALSTSRGELVIPFYPISNKIELGTMTNEGVTVSIDATMSAFYTSKGTFGKVGTGVREGLSFEMRNGDYATISRNDLKILIRLGPHKKEIDVPYDPSYKGKISKLAVETRFDAQIVGVAFLLSIILMTGFIGGLMMRPDNRPTKKEDLNDEYNLAFIHPGHLKHLPEALHDNLDRSQPLQSAIKFYDAISRLYLGIDTRPNKLLFNSTSNLYDGLYEDYEYNIQEVLETNKEKSASHLQSDNTALLSIPTIRGETFPGSILRLTRKVASMHDTFEKNLEYRRRTSDLFSSDTMYDFKVYKELGTKGTLADKIGALRISKQPKNEVAMYLEAENISQKAKREQDLIEKSRTPITNLTSENGSPVGIDLQKTLVSIDIPYRDIDEGKVLSLATSVFGSERKQKIIEPVIGEIRKELISKIINKRKFELQLCFELALRKNRNLRGSIELTWLLDTRGRISDLKVANSTIRNRAMQQCVLQKVSRWKFPRPRKGSIEITYPFHFQLNSDSRKL